MKRLIQLIVYTLLLSMLLTACGQKATPADETPVDPNKDRSEEMIEEGNSEKEAPVNTELIEQYTGTWISSGDTNDTLVLNADGTCSVNAYNFYWTTDTVNDRFFRIENERGELIYFFYIWEQDGNTALNLAGLIVNREGEYFSKRSTSKNFYRPEVIEAMNVGGVLDEVLEYIGGDWILVNPYNDTSSYPKTLHVEAGQLSIDGTAYDYTFSDYFKQNYEGGLPDYVTLTYYDEDGTKVGSVEFNARYNVDNVLTGMFANIQTSGNWYDSYYQAEPIEITVDNWQDYFEFSDRIYEYKNSFDELEAFSYIACLSLKEEYRPRFLSGSSIAIEYTVAHDAAVSITYDASNGSYTMTPLEEVPDDLWVNPENSYTYDGTLYGITYDMTSSYIRTSACEVDGTTYSVAIAFPQDITIERITGTLYLYLIDYSKY